jgi:hypothetical protein
MFSFIGIPYAVPLLTTHRWTHSKPMKNLAECHEGTFKAHSQNVVSTKKSILLLMLRILNRIWRYFIAETCKSIILLKSHDYILEILLSEMRMEATKELKICLRYIYKNTMLNLDIKRLFILNCFVNINIINTKSINTLGSMFFAT